MKVAHVELKNGKVIRIFRTAKASAVFYANLVLHPDNTATITTMPRPTAVEAIRRQLFEQQKHLCAWCGEELTWGSCQMHEKIPRGKGGEISLLNSTILCYDCHQGSKPGAAHRGRRLHFSKQNTIFESVV
jgi:hypothetical protein